MQNGPVEILVVDDSPGDVGVIEAAFQEWQMPCQLTIVEDGERALQYLRAESPYQAARRPDLILLDWNLPRKHGGEVLAVVKSDPLLHSIPVIVLTTSDAEQDVRRAYELHANCYMTKPLYLAEFMSKLRGIESYWLTMVRLPHQNPEPSVW